MYKKLLILLLLSLAMASTAQNTTEVTIKLLTADQIGTATLDQEPFFEWVKNLKAAIEEHVKSETGNKEVIALFTLHKKGPADISVASRPVADKKLNASLESKLRSIAAPNVKYAGYSFSFTAKINAGCEDQAKEFEPALVFPMEKELNAFKALDLKAKKTALQSWVNNDVIPVLAYYEKQADPKFEGVINMGKLLEAGKFSNTEELTSHNFNYWRAGLEMGQGNQIIPFSKVCMQVSNGEFDRAQKLVFIVNTFSDESTLPDAFYYELSNKLRMLDNELNAEIEKGIALHDKGKYKDAVKHYEAILKAFPNSAWTHYELYFSRTAGLQDPKDGDKIWNESKMKVYGADPLYTVSPRAHNGKEGYQMFRRSEMKELFRSKEKFRSDLVKYADIALDLEEYSFAAQLYWMIASHFKPEDYNNRELIMYYLYCVDKLGQKDLLTNFKGDHPAEFKKIADERKRLMEENAFYKSFGPGE